MYFTARLNGVPPWAYFFFLSPVSDATGVGHKPESFALVGSGNVVRSNNTPCRIEPHRGKVGKHPVKSSSHKER
jgi:hypothetical protein